MTSGGAAKRQATIRELQNEAEVLKQRVKELESDLAVSERQNELLWELSQRDLERVRSEKKAAVAKGELREIEAHDSAS